LLDNNLSALLEHGVAQLQLVLDSEQKKKLVDYVKLLSHWNKAYNLTAVRDEGEMMVKHILDSLSVVPFFAGRESIIDIGSGAGLPGVPLAICYPMAAITTVDSNGKKTRFMQHVVTHLGLSNITVLNKRAEQLAAEKKYDAVTSRAFTSLTDMLAKTNHLLQNKGLFLAMKGVYPTEELSELPTGYKVTAVHELKVPGLAAERHLVAIALD
jgi:16S rRNA (guanine527-N7)-methyltransferase|tara:strand:+ start:25478 stop:26113 length:636 start_codon:yes stop_codon:yes gene_type:complete